MVILTIVMLVYQRVTLGSSDPHIIGEIWTICQIKCWSTPKSESMMQLFSHNSISSLVPAGKPRSKRRKWVAFQKLSCLSASIWKIASYHLNVANQMPCTSENWYGWKPLRLMAIGAGLWWCSLGFKAAYRISMVHWLMSQKSLWSHVYIYICMIIYDYIIYIIFAFQIHFRYSNSQKMQNIFRILKELRG